MPAFIPGYTQPAYRQPYMPVFPKESLPAAPVQSRGSGYLKAILETFDKEIELCDSAPRLCIENNKQYTLRAIKTIRNAFMGFEVLFAGENKTQTVYSWQLPDREVNMLTEHILSYFNPDPAKVEYQYLRIINSRFIMEHGELGESDFEKIFAAQKLMATLRLGAQAHQHVFPGDTLQGAYYGGEHPFTNGVILSRPTWAEEGDTKIHFCANPYVPYICSNGSLDTSGGPFFSAEKEHFTFLGEEERLFWCFGHDGACGNGGIYFPCRSNRWQLGEGAGI